MHLGSAIRARREELGLTLDEVARRSGVSRGMLSEVERDRKSPTIRVVCLIAEGLGCSVSDLIGQEPVARFELRRTADRRPLVDPRSGVERHLLSPAMSKRGIEVVWYVIPRGQTTGSFPPHQPGVVEHVTVVAGTVEARLGSEAHLLDVGDSVTYRADVDHEFIAHGRSRGEFIVVIDSTKVR